MKKYRCPHCGKNSISTFNKITPGLYGPPVRGSVKSDSECPECGGKFCAVINNKKKLSRTIFFIITVLPFISAIILLIFPDFRIFSVLGLMLYFYLFCVLIFPLYNYFFTYIVALDADGNVIKQNSNSK